MSAAVRIVAPGQLDRLVPLENGSRTLGASLNCEFLLLDQGIADEQFLLRVDDDHMTLTLLPEAHAKLDGVPMVPGVEIVLKLGMKIMVGDVEFTFKGAGIDTAAGLSVIEDEADAMEALGGVVKNRALPERIRPGIRTAGAGAVAVCLTALVWVGYGDGMIAVSKGVTPEEIGASPVMRPPEELSSSAVSKGRFMSDLPTADGMSEGPKLEMSAASIEKALKASAIVLAGIDRSAIAEEVQNGVLKVSGIRSDDPKAEDMRRALLADIPTLDNVSFSLNAEDRIKTLKSQVVGVWAGKRPYVVLLDGELIKPSQELLDGVILTGVFEKHIEVAIGPEQHKVTLQ